MVRIGGWLVARAAAMLVAAALAACGGADGKPAAAPDPIAEGRRLFLAVCRHCHGERGDGTGPAGRVLSRKPRDLTSGLFKYGSVPSGELPTQDDLVRIIRGPVHGRAPFPVSDRQLHDIVAFVMTLSPRWRAKGPGTPIEVAPDPWGEARRADAIARGARLYHIEAQCLSCHPHYLTREELTALEPDAAWGRPEPERPVVIDSEYGPLAATDFLADRLRAGAEPADVYRSIAAGIGGTGMPTWKGALPEEDLWALVHYVRSMAALQNSPAARALRERVKASWAGAPAAEPAP